MSRLAFVLAVNCGSSPQTAPQPQPVATLAPAAVEALCITNGEIGTAGDSASIRSPVVRGFAHHTTGEAAALDVVYRGKTDTIVALASGDVRAQLGLKLRAADGCNLVYVMWRIEPAPQIVVQIKANPGKHTHKDCGRNGYIRVKPMNVGKVFVPSPGSAHRLRAEIDGDSLVAWLDDRMIWQGTLPAAARELRGPAGFRTDNVKADVTLLVAPDPSGETTKCTTSRYDD